MNSVWCKKAVFDPLSQTVGVDGIAEVAIGISAVIAQRSCRHAKLGRAREVIEDFTPTTFRSCTPAVAFIDNDQVEEVWRVLLIKSWASFVFGERLINRKVHFAALNHFAVFDLVASVSKRRECLVLWIVDKDVAVGQIEDAWSTVRSPFRFHLAFQSL